MQKKPLIICCGYSCQQYWIKWIPEKTVQASVKSIYQWQKAKITSHGVPSADFSSQYRNKANKFTLFDFALEILEEKNLMWQITGLKIHGEKYKLKYYIDDVVLILTEPQIAKKSVNEHNP